MLENDNLNDNESNTNNHVSENNETKTNNENNNSTSNIAGYDAYYNSLKGYDEIEESYEDTEGTYSSTPTYSTQPSAKSHRFSKLPFLFMIIFGLVFFGLGFGMLISNSTKASTYKQTEAVIVDIFASTDRDGDTTHTVYVDYEIDGVNYSNVQLDVYSSSFYEGKTITIDYNPKNPREITVLGVSNIIFAIPLGIGVIITILGIVLMIKLNKRNKALADGTLAVTHHEHATINTGTSVITEETTTYSDGSTSTYRTKKSKPSTFLIALIPFSLFILITTSMMFSSTEANLKYYEPVEAVVVDVKNYNSTENKIYVDFEYNNNTYNNVVFTSENLNINVGDELTVYCNSLNPTMVIEDINPENSAKIVLYSVGGVLLALGVTALIYTIIKSKKNRG